MIHGSFNRCSKAELIKEVFCRGMILDSKDTKKKLIKKLENNIFEHKEFESKNPNKNRTAGKVNVAMEFRHDRDICGRISLRVTQSDMIRKFIKTTLNGTCVAVLGDGHCLRRAIAKLEQISP